MANYNFYITNKKCKEQAKEYLRYTWKNSANITLLFYGLILILSGLVALPCVFVAWWMVFPLLLVGYIFWSLLDYGYKKYFWELTQLKDVHAKILFSGFSKKAGKIIKTYFKKLFLGIFWLVLLIFPYFIKQPAYAMATYILWDKPEVQNPLKESKRLMNNNIDRYAKLQLSFAHWYLLLFVTAFVAGIWIFPYLATAESVFYEDLKTDF